MRTSTKSKLRRANTGVRNPFYGKKHSTKTKELLRSVNNRRIEFYRQQARHFSFDFSDFWSEEERLKKAQAMIAELNPNWKGGTHLVYDTYAFELFRREVLKRDNYACQVCGKTTDEKGTNLHAHHIDGDAFNMDSVNGITLCKKCHIGEGGVHKIKDGIQRLQEILEKGGKYSGMDN